MTRSSLAAALMGLLSLFVLQSAAADNVTLLPGESHSDTVTASFGDFINYTWHGPSVGGSFTGDIMFVVTDPDGVVIENVTSSFESDQIWLSKDGTYTFTWTNADSSELTLFYSLELWDIGVGNTEEVFDVMLVALLIGAIVVVVVVLVLVVVVLGGDRKRPSGPAAHSPMQRTPSGEAPSPYVPRMCPRCGSPTDSQHVFCTKCGFRVR